MGLYILIISGLLKEIIVFVVCDVCLLDFDHSDERLPGHSFFHFAICATEDRSDIRFKRKKLNSEET